MFDEENSFSDVPKICLVEKTVGYTSRVLFHMFTWAKWSFVLFETVRFLCFAPSFSDSTWFAHHEYIVVFPTLVGLYSTWVYTCCVDEIQRTPGMAGIAMLKTTTCRHVVGFFGQVLPGPGCSHRGRAHHRRTWWQIGGRRGWQ